MIRKTIIKVPSFWTSVTNHFYVQRNKTAYTGFKSLSMSSTPVELSWNELINFLKLRGYSSHFLKKEINYENVSSHVKKRLIKPQTHINNSNRTPFVITNNPALPNFSTAVRKDINILQSSNRCKQIFPSPIVAYKRSPNLCDLLVRSTLHDCSIQQEKPSPGGSKRQSSTLPYLSIF